MSYGLDRRQKLLLRIESMEHRHHYDLVANPDLAELVSATLAEVDEKMTKEQYEMAENLVDGLVNVLGNAAAKRFAFKWPHL